MTVPDLQSLKITSKTALADLPTRIDLQAGKKKINKALRKTRKELGDLQNTLYAHSKYGVVVCFQGMDTARYLVARILLETLQTYTDIKEPELPENIREQIDNCRKKLMEE